MLKNNTLISGIYLIYMKWDLIWFENKIKNELFTVKYIELQALLLQHFDKDYCEKILEAINKFEKVIIDFDKNIVNKIIEKDEPFTNELKKYFSVQKVESCFDPISRTITSDELKEEG